METWQIVFIAVYGSVLAWLSLTTIQHGKKLAVLQNIYQTIDDIKESQDKMSARMDIFLKTEIDVLKDLAKRT
jgi:hypothetical protein